jgi:hypothetical protein
VYYVEAGVVGRQVAGRGDPWAWPVGRRAGAVEDFAKGNAGEEEPRNAGRRRAAHPGGDLLLAVGTGRGTREERSTG